MRKLILLLLATSLSACGSLQQIDRDLNSSVGQMLGTYSAPLLAGSSRPSGCSDEKCRALDEMERIGYDMIRKKETTYSRFVDGWYQARSRLYPDSNDGSAVHEYRAF